MRDNLPVVVVSRALQAHHHDYAGGLAGQGELRLGAAHELGQLLVNDANNLLAGG